MRIAKHKNNIIAALDLGGAKTVCVIAKFTNDDQLDVLGVGHTHTRGVKAGVITDINAAEKSILKAVELAEREAEASISKVYINLPANILSSYRLCTEIDINDHAINQKDLDKLLLQALSLCKDAETVHAFVSDYVIDRNMPIDNPLDLYGNRLSASYHILQAAPNLLLNFKQCLARCQLEVVDYICEPYAIGINCIPKEDLELGAILIDIGASSSSISIFKNYNLLFTAGIPIGGMHITNDIAQVLGIDFAQAERIKILHGNLNYVSTDQGEVILETEHGDELNQGLLYEIIRARLEEIIVLLHEQLEESNLQDTGINKLFISGGVSLTPGAVDFTSSFFDNVRVRMAKPSSIDGHSYEDSSIATAIGMIKYAHNPDLRSLDKRQVEPHKTAWSWLRALFS